MDIEKMELEHPFMKKEETVKTLEWTTVDKSKWGRGPWDVEPDKKQWMDECTGYPCLIVRGPVGALCGYVGVHEGHPYFGKHYDEPEVRVHGGLTFADSCAKTDDPSLHICHVVENDENDRVWWFGFDCAHYMDLCPASMSFSGVYRDQEYVESEIRYLARQLKEMEGVEA